VHEAGAVKGLDALSDTTGGTGLPLSQVRGRMEQGQTLEQIQESLELSAYADWALYERFLKLNIEAVHRELSEAP